MPRVSEQHLAARRQQILDAARRCFLRNGFHQTSMQDVISEAGLSVGAVYRYFTSKHEIVAAIAGQTVDGVGREFNAIAAHEPQYPLIEAMDRVLAVVDTQLGPDGMFRLAVQVWAEAMRDQTVAALVAERYPRLREFFTTLAQQAIDRGELAADTDVTAVGHVLLGMIPGYALQRLLTGAPDHQTFMAGIHALMSHPPGPASLTADTRTPDAPI
ncbi:TetR/AcrR family transcriptional regulator [Polymorphospora sp. NPDC051019]|uniref:TetR/AcrR family transcriptional regulator n=1 Tax=Polymorphospora sp. NPDC051019 TaxID=3155725 RepID=UPI00343B6ED2